MDFRFKRQLLSGLAWLASIEGPAEVCFIAYLHRRVYRNYEMHGCSPCRGLVTSLIAFHGLCFTLCWVLWLSACRWSRSRSNGKEEKLKVLKWCSACLCPDFLGWDYSMCACLHTAFLPTYTHKLTYAAQLCFLQCTYYVIQLFYLGGCLTVPEGGRGMFGKHASSTASSARVRRDGKRYCWRVVREHQPFLLLTSLVQKKYFQIGKIIG